jgi:hypothetical protein
LKALDNNQIVPVVFQPIAILQEITHTLYTAGVQAWIQIFNIFSPPFKNIGLIAIAYAALAFIAIAFLLYKLNFESGDSQNKSWAYQAIGLGLLGILAGRLPSWIAGLPFLLSFDSDRLMISVMIGSCFLLAGVIDLLVPSRKNPDLHFEYYPRH